MDWFASVPQGFWKEAKNQRSFFDSLASVLQIRNPDDWTKVTSKLVLQNGGAFLHTYFKGSVPNALKELYPETNWSKIFYKPRRNFFTSIENQISFLTHLSQKYELNSFRDWKKVSLSLIRSNGGGVSPKFFLNNQIVSASQISKLIYDNFIKNIS